jgi:hypothetical protein
MRAFIVAGAFLTALALFVEGCGGGGSSRSSIPQTSNPSSKSQYKVKVKIPSASGSSSSAVRRVKYVSVSVQSIVVQILGNGGAQLVQGNDYVNVTANGSSGAGSCTTTDGSTTCTLSLNAAIGSGGTFTVVVATYDAQQTQMCAPSATPACSGNLLSISNIPQSVTPGNTINVTLGGIPAYLQPVEFVSGYLSGKGSAITVYGPGPQTLSLEFLDADNNVIIGAGAPTVTPLNNTSSTLTATVTTSGNSGLYTLHLAPVTTTVGGLQVVQAGTVTPAFTISIPNSTLSANIALPITIAHSAVYAAANAVSPPGTLTIYGFFDGNTTPSWNVYDTGTSFIGIATDVLGNVWAADAYNNKIAEWTGQQISSAPGENDPDPSPTSFGEPSGVAFDASGNAYVMQIASSPWKVVQFNAPNPQSTPNFGNASPFTYAASSSLYPGNYISADASGDVYGVFTYGGYYYATVYANGSMTPTPQWGPQSAAIKGVAWDPIHNGYIWTIFGGTAYMTNSSTQQGSQNVSVITGAGLATDSLANLFIGNFSGAGVVEYTAPGYSSTTTIGPSISGALSVAVFPNALIGQQSPVGVLPNPTPSPIPIPAPT